VKPYFLLRSAFGSLIYIGVIFELINIYMTLRITDIDRISAERRKQAEDLTELMPLSSGAKRS
jgi:hypothetical protein